jgi:hypothetical protein
MPAMPATALAFRSAEVQYFGFDGRDLDAAGPIRKEEI